MAGKPRALRRPARLVGVGGIAAWLGVKPDTVSKWLIRYPYDGTETPTPAPDYEVVPGRNGADSADAVWSDTAANRQAWQNWQASRPSQGRPGMPKPRSTTAATA